MATALGCCPSNGMCGARLAMGLSQMSRPSPELHAQCRTVLIADQPVHLCHRRLQSLQPRGFRRRAAAPALG